MTGIESLLNAVRAGYAFFYVQSYEIEGHTEKMLNDIGQFEFQGEKVFSTYLWDSEKNPDPEEVKELDNLDIRTVGIYKNLHWYLQDSTGQLNFDMVQWFQNRTEVYTTKESRKTVIIIGAESFENAIPACLQKDFMELKFSFPDVAEIELIYDFVVKSAQNNPNFVAPTEKEKEMIILNSRGMTKREITNAYSYSLISTKGKLDPKIVQTIQAREVEKTSGARIGEYEVVEPLGLENIKEFVVLTGNSPFAKGILLLGPPGTGKSHLAKWLASELNKKIIEVEMANLMGGIVGQTEENVRVIIEVISANAPCVVFIDEIEKGLSGVKSGSSSTVGGDTVAKRAFAQFLKFLSDTRPEGVYVIATCNDISSLPPEYVRAERWDTAPFFIDLPEYGERKQILDYYKGVYEVEGEMTEKQTVGWSGAELKSVCRIAAMMNKSIEQCERFIVPVSRTMKSDIEQLRQWAVDKTIPASTPVNNGKKKKTDRDLNF